MIFQACITPRLGSYHPMSFTAHPSSSLRAWYTRRTPAVALITFTLAAASLTCTHSASLSSFPSLFHFPLLSTSPLAHTLFFTLKAQVTLRSTSSPTACSASFSTDFFPHFFRQSLLHSSPCSLPTSAMSDTLHHSGLSSPKSELPLSVSTHDTSGLSYNPDWAFSMLPPTGKSIHIKEYPLQCICFEALLVFTSDED